MSDSPEKVIDPQSNEASDPQSEKKKYYKRMDRSKLAKIIESTLSTEERIKALSELATQQDNKDTALKSIQALNEMQYGKPKLNSDDTDSGKPLRVLVTVHDISKTRSKGKKTSKKRNHE